MNDKLTFAAILLGGYLLGRTKKLKMALAVAGALGVRELKEHPDLLKAGGAALSTPAVKKLTDELSGRLVEAGKTAVVAAATKRVDSLVSNLQERTGSPLPSRGARDEGGSADEAEEPADEAAPDESPLEEEEAEDTEQEEAKAGTPSEGEEPEDEEPEDEQPQDEDEEPAPKAAPRRRRTTSGSSSRASDQGRSKQGTSAGGAKKSTGTRSTTRSTGGKTTRKGSR